MGTGRRLGRYLGVSPRPVPPWCHSGEHALFAGVALPCRWGGCARRYSKRRDVAHALLGRRRASSPRGVSIERLCLRSSYTAVPHSDASWLDFSHYNIQPHSLPAKAPHTPDAWLWGGLCVYLLLLKVCYFSHFILLHWVFQHSSVKFGYYYYYYYFFPPLSLIATLYYSLAGFHSGPCRLLGVCL